MKVCGLFSGGKDSTLALLVAKESHEIACLLTALPKRDDSYMFHVPNVRWTKLQGEAMGIQVKYFYTEGVKEEEVEDLKRALSKVKEDHGIKGVVSGAIASTYQFERIKRICDELGLESITPLWKKSQDEIMEMVLDKEFEVIVVGVASEGLTKEWLGKRINKDMLERLNVLRKKHGIHIAGEGGEMETFVTDCPLFKKKVEITKNEIIWEGNSGVFEIEKAVLINK
jgi:ABC transporter with metal-binding/Fe-S-binding domain ATP-binding protein